jgi:hypothetical protein
VKYFMKSSERVLQAWTLTSLLCVRGVAFEHEISEAEDVGKYYELRRNVRGHRL